MGYYVYKVKYYVPGLEKEEKEYGITAAETYAEAVSNVEEDYDNVISVSAIDVSFDYDCKTLTLPKEAYDLIKYSEG